MTLYFDLKVHPNELHTQSIDYMKDEHVFLICGPLCQISIEQWFTSECQWSPLLHKHYSKNFV